MKNELLRKRLAGIREALMGDFASGEHMSSSSKGIEREIFIRGFLQKVFPPPFRFASGDITDTHGACSGQTDVVVEYPFLPSVPTISSDVVRAYLAEGVAAVLEIKSDLTKQWDEVVKKSELVSKLKREFGNHMVQGWKASESIPFYVVGFRGWSDTKKLIEHHLSSKLSGILVLESSLFVYQSFTDDEPGYLLGDEETALWAFISCLHAHVSSLKMTSASPFAYA